MKHSRFAQIFVLISCDFHVLKTVFVMFIHAPKTVFSIMDFLIFFMCIMCVFKHLVLMLTIIYAYVCFDSFNIAGYKCIKRIKIKIMDKVFVLSKGINAYDCHYVLVVMNCYTK